MCCCGGMIMPVETLQAPSRALPAKKRTPFVLSGRHVLAGMVLFFLVVAAVNGLMMTVALRTMPGLDARNGYDVSQNYNAEIDAAAAQAARGLSIEASVVRRPYGALVSADVKRASKQPLVGATVWARLEHPATRQHDRVLVLKETSPGRYEAMAAGLPPGAWTLVLRVEQADGPASDGARPVFVSRNRLMVEG